MKKIKLTRGKLALVDDSDYEHLSGFSWYAYLDKHAAEDTWYAYGSETIDGKLHSTKMHRVIVNAPSGYLVDHKDGNGLNNQRHNLRVANKSLNAVNSRKRPGFTSEYKGVSNSDGTWVSFIKMYGTSLNIGKFKSEIDAAMAYDFWARLLFREFAWLNFPDSYPNNPITTSRGEFWEIAILAEKAGFISGEEAWRVSERLDRRPRDWDSHLRDLCEILESRGYKTE